MMVGQQRMAYLSTTYAIFRSWHHFLFLDKIGKNQENKVLNTFENIIENGAFAPK